MNPAVFATVTSDACLLGAQGTGANDFGPDRITSNSYDDAGKLTQVQRAYRVTTANGFPATLQQTYAAYTCSPNGRQTSVTDASGNRAEMTWDGFLDLMTDARFDSYKFHHGEFGCASHRQDNSRPH